MTPSVTGCGSDQFEPQGHSWVTHFALLYTKYRGCGFHDFTQILKKFFHIRSLWRLMTLTALSFGP